MGKRQPHMNQHKARLRSRAEQCKHQDEGGRGSAVMGGAHRREGVAALGSGEEPEGKQEGQRAEARHDDVDQAGLAILGIAVASHRQRPGRERHELP
jgi:hypothetical protein